LSLLLVFPLTVMPALGYDGQKPLREKENPQLIGKRDINKGQLNFYSLEKEVAIGRRMAAEMNRYSKLLDDSVVLELVNRVAQNIVINSDIKIPVTVKVVDSSDINAFALPGGFLYVNRGLIEAADNEADLTAAAQEKLRRIAEWLLESPHRTISFRIEGNCDPRGTAEYNMGLGDRRARAAKDFLVSLGVEANRIDTISYGLEKATGGYEGSPDVAPSWAHDRRDDFVYLSGGKQ
jgi:OmpA family/Peptidase family M48